ncbi:MAG: hypothetical protein DWP92_07855 [Armatimonadetes bacterium]|nr:MAG: hypothetical protein DWP92_07855 [Armatimonadota bacterium]
MDYLGCNECAADVEIRWLAGTLTFLPASTLVRRSASFERMQTLQTRMVRVLALLFALSLLMVSCGGDSAATPTTTTVETTTTTVETTTTTVETTTTTTVPATTTTAAATTTIPAAVPSGSGCSPSGDVLPDGEWFGFVEDIDILASEFTLDVACYFEGDQANPAAVEDAYPSVPLELTPYIRNSNPEVFTVEAFGATLVEDPFQGNVDWDAWVEGFDPGSGCAEPDYSNCPVWVTIDYGGIAVYIDATLMEWSGDDRGS